MGVVYLIRHGRAGDRYAFPGDDRERPLTPNGARQAEKVADRLMALEPLPTRVLSSPAVRCTETVAPLADRLGLEIETAEWLDEGSDIDSVLAGLSKTAAFTVAACTHGDVVWGIIERLARAGVDIGERPDAQKASVWVIDWPAEPGQPTDGGPQPRATYIPPPDKHGSTE